MSEVRMPRLTQTMAEGTIVRWLRGEGEAVRAGEPLLEVVTDKATVEVEAPASGTLARILVPEGEVPVGAPIAILLARGETLSEGYGDGVSRGSAPASTPYPGRTGRTSPTRPTAPRSGGRAMGGGVAENDAPAGRVRVSPLAKRLAAELGVDLSRVLPSGPGGLITEADVRRAEGAAAPHPDPVPSGEGGVDEEIVPLTGIRKTIADRLSLSRRTAADVTTVAEVDMTEVSTMRESVGVTYTAFVARAAAMALTEFSILNSRIEGDRIIVGKRVHLGVAVALDEGLKVAMVRDAHAKNLRRIGAELAELARRAAEGRLSPAELTGSTFTVTNSGVYGSLLFTPIINPPESAILGMGKIAKTPVVRDDQIVVRKMMYLCLTYDHRAIDGAPAVKFLQRVKSLLEAPGLL